MPWLNAAILAYLILAAVFLVDKHILTSKIPNPKVYTFYVGLLGMLVVLLAPFVGFYFPEPFQVFLAFLAGIFIMVGAFFFLKGLSLFEPSRIVPAVGGALPVFTFLIILAVSSGREVPAARDLVALIFLVCGSFLISYERAKKISFESLKTSIPAAFFFALSFVLAKYVYLTTPFWTAQILIRVSGGFAVLVFLLFSPELKRELFGVKMGLEKKTAALMLANQALGAGAIILQHWAVALAPLAYLALVNALQGTQYVFLLGLAVLLSAKFPQVLKENISKEVIFQKIIAILLIGGGLVFLTLN